MSNTYDAFAPDGTAIVGTLEVINGCADLVWFEKQDDGSMQPRYTGTTEVYWEGQMTVRRNGETVYVDDNGKEWLDYQVIFRQRPGPEPKAEHLLDADELCKKYGSWGEHPNHPVTDWQAQVTDGDTRLGYWDWLVVELETAAEDSIEPDSQ